ncbi:lycopene cyclase family protein [Streptomyces sp. TR06-5]|uniref:lycopene cyclase family protein n=1 Tax=Streptomyces sp. TR06-5 TaxID=3385976 RepID=UPI0039A198EF
MREADVVVIGAGAAGLSLARLLARAPASRGPRTVALLETPDTRRRAPDRTWCFWGPDDAEPDRFEEASWGRLRVHGPTGGAVERDTAPLRYRMIRSATYAREVSRLLSEDGRVRRVAATVTGVTDGSDAASVRCVTADGHRSGMRARWVFDSRPKRPLPPARTLLLQHFRGWFLRTDRDRFDPGVAELMDFRVPQPHHGLAFGYVLPFDSRTALVEYTEFSSGVLDRAAYERALRHYADTVLRLGHYRVEAAEQGVIPMTDAVFPRRTGARVFPLGAAAGATRPSTGYTFAAVQRQVHHVADALCAGRTPLPPRLHSRRARAMDAVLLRALDTGRISGAVLFEELFRHHRAPELLRFLDGGTSPLEDLRIGAAAPVLPMLRTAAELPFLRRRPRGGGT